MSFKTNPIITRLGLTVGWKNKTYIYNKVAIKWLLLYLIFKHYFKIHGINLVTCSIKKNVKMQQYFYKNKQFSFLLLTRIFWNINQKFLTFQKILLLLFNQYKYYNNYFFMQSNKRLNPLKKKTQKLTITKQNFLIFYNSIKKIIKNYLQLSLKIIFKNPNLLQKKNTIIKILIKKILLFLIKTKLSSYYFNKLKYNFINSKLFVSNIKRYNYSIIKKIKRYNTKILVSFYKQKQIWKKSIQKLKKFNYNKFNLILSNQNKLNINTNLKLYKKYFNTKFLVKENIFLNIFTYYIKPQYDYIPKRTLLKEQRQLGYKNHWKTRFLTLNLYKKLNYLTLNKKGIIEQSVNFFRQYFGIFKKKYKQKKLNNYFNIKHKSLFIFYKLNKKKRYYLIYKKNKNFIFQNNKIFLKKNIKLPILYKQYLIKNSIFLKKQQNINNNYFHLLKKKYLQIKNYFNKKDIKINFKKKIGNKNNQYLIRKKIQLILLLKILIQNYLILKKILKKNKWLKKTKKIKKKIIKYIQIINNGFKKLNLFEKYIKLNNNFNYFFNYMNNKTKKSSWQINLRYNLKTKIKVKKNQIEWFYKKWHKGLTQLLARNEKTTQYKKFLYILNKKKKIKYFIWKTCGITIQNLTLKEPHLRYITDPFIFIKQNHYKLFRYSNQNFFNNLLKIIHLHRTYYNPRILTEFISKELPLVKNHRQFLKAIRDILLWSNQIFQAQFIDKIQISVCGKLNKSTRTKRFRFNIGGSIAPANLHQTLTYDLIHSYPKIGSFGIKAYNQVTTKSIILAWMSKNFAIKYLRILNKHQNFINDETSIYHAMNISNLNYLKRIKHKYI